MDCREAKLRLADLRLGALAPAALARVEEHLGACAACRRRAEEVGEVLEALRRDAAFERAAAAPAVDLRAVFSGRPTLRPVAWLRRIAALLLAALGLASLFRTRVTAGDGALTVAFALPWTKPGAALRPIAPATPPLAFVSAAGVREAVEAAVVPAFWDLATWMAAGEERRARDLSTIAAWIEERRLEDARNFAGALVATRADLRLTQEVLDEVAERAALRRPGW